VAVQGFYIISGFYMALILNGKYNFPGSTWIFYKQRYLRLVPMYWVAVICVVGIGAFYSFRAERIVGKLEAWSQFSGNFSFSTLLFLCVSQISMFGLDALMFFGMSGDPLTMHFTTNWATEQLPAVKFMLVPPAWSLSLELLFYLVAPFIVRRSIRFQLALVAFTFALRITVGLTLNLSEDPWHNRFFPFEAGLFVLGSLAYRCLPLAENFIQTRSMLRHAFTLAICAAVFFYKGIPIHEEIRHWGFLALTLLSVPLLFAATKRNATDRKIGEISYPLYLSHPITLFAAEPLFRRMNGLPQEIAILTVPVIVAAGAYVLIERPFEMWRSRTFERQLKSRTKPSFSAAEQPALTKSEP
jgi:peptidoglycan/LPS O-acetylase OafA/YrhL